LKKINISINAISKVIFALAEGKKNMHIPYR